MPFGWFSAFFKKKAILQNHKAIYYNVLGQWFPNFSDARTTKNILVIREAQNIDLYGDWRTTWASLADHQWSAMQTLGITVLGR